MHRAHLHIATFLTLFASPACFLNDSDEDTSASESDIYGGGFVSESKKLSAIGAIVELASDKNGGVVWQKCTGTLIGPHTVLTAAHCVEKYKGKNSVNHVEHAFHVGFDAAQPEQVVRIVGGYVGAIYSGGLTGRGGDIGLMFLAEDVTDVEPFAVSTTPLDQSHLGKNFFVAGYGQTSTTDPVGPPLRTRQLGTVKLAALSGDPMQQLWSSPEDLSNWLLTELGINISAAALTSYYNAQNHILLEGHVGYFTSIEEGVQVARGDSGGPVFRMAQGIEIVAVTASTFSVTSNGIQTLFGGAYSGLTGSQAHADFIAQNESEYCRGVPTGGTCSGDVAIACNPQSSGGQAISSLNCADLGLWCAVENGAPACVDPIPVATPTTCSVIGKYLDPNNVAYEFKSDGTFTIRNIPRGTYSFENGLLTVDETGGACFGSSSGYHSLEFTQDCSQFTFRKIHDGCRLRGESWELTTLTRQP